MNTPVMIRHQLFDHPMFDERPLQDVLEPFGFEVSLRTTEPPIDLACDDPDAINDYAADPQAYIDSLAFNHPTDFTEIDRGENDEGDIYSVAVRAKTVFAQLLLCADSSFAGSSSNSNRSYIDVYRERMRQLSTENFSRERDDGYDDGELAAAAGAYALHAHDGGSREIDGTPAWWPWKDTWWKPTDPRRNLVKAGALILAEIERLDRAAERPGGAA